MLDTSSFSSSYSKLKEMYRWNKYSLRQELASANNCIPIGKSSCYADMVAVPKDYPDIVVKICSGTDMFIEYAHLIVAGKLVGPHILKVFSETEIAPGVWLFVMERLSRDLTGHEYEMTVYRSRLSSYSMPKRGRYAGKCKTLRKDLEKIKFVLDDGGYSWCFDLHLGNVMLRADGTIVFIDPIC